MKKILLAAAIAVFSIFGVFAETPLECFYYELCSQKVLDRLGLKGDFLYVSVKNGDEYPRVIEYPKEIEGFPVVAIELPYDLMNGRRMVEKISIPETVQLIDRDYSDFQASIRENLVKLIEYTGETSKPLYFVDGTNNAGEAIFVGSMPQKGRKIYCKGVYVRDVGNSFVFTKNFVFDKAHNNGDFNNENPYFNSPDVEELIFEEGITEMWNCGTPNKWSKYNEKLVKVVIPSSVKKIKMYAFTDCANLKEVVFPAGAKYTYETAVGAYEHGESWAFAGCSSLGLKTKVAIKETGYPSF
ncbi:MAG: leucine-rich repeat domain-containing protein [Treponema sp.]|nr:leucine-rich repeat domain-containing protein [Treponema sp.]